MVDKILRLASTLFREAWGIIEEIFIGEKDMDKLPMEELIPEPQTKDAPGMLLEASRQYEGEDASPQDFVDDALGCAESVSRVIQAIYPDFPVITGTWTLREHLRQDKRFKATLNMDPGNVIVCPTGSGNGKIRGHTGVIGKDNRIYSNNSFTGIWEPNYTVDEWINRYVGLGKLKIYVYEPVEKPYQI